MNDWVNELELVGKHRNDHEAFVWLVLVEDELDSFLLMLLECLQHHRVHEALLLAEEDLDIDAHLLAEVDAFEHDFGCTSAERLQPANVDLEQQILSLSALEELAD